MRIVTLNIGKFGLLMDESLNNFLDEYRPDIAIIQECKYIGVLYLFPKMKY
ncbi:MAG: hypothetical protein ACOH15_11590 [Acetobacterium sp.]